jgi:hypothetical protein
VTVTLIGCVLVVGSIRVIVSVIVTVTNCVIVGPPTVVVIVTVGTGDTLVVGQSVSYFANPMDSLLFPPYDLNLSRSGSLPYLLGQRLTPI